MFNVYIYIYICNDVFYQKRYSIMYFYPNLIVLAIVPSWAQWLLMHQSELITSLKGVQRLKGDAKAIDQVLLMKQVGELTDLVVAMDRKMGNTR